MYIVEKIIVQYESCGYSIDGYIKELNLAIEFDEKHHFSNGKLSKYDIDRQAIYQKELSCIVFRIDEERQWKIDKKLIIKKLVQLVNKRRLLYGIIQ